MWTLVYEFEHRIVLFLFEKTSHRYIAPPEIVSIVSLSVE